MSKEKRKEKALAFTLKNKGYIDKIRQWGPYIFGLLLLGTLITIGAVLGNSIANPAPEDPYQQAQIALEAKRYGEAYYYLNQAIDENPDQTEQYMSLAELLQNKGRAEEAIEVLEQALNHNVDRVIIKDKLADLYLSTKQYSKAVEHLNTLVSSSTNINDRPKYLYKLGVALIKTNNFDKARSSFSQIIEGYSNSEWYYKASYELALWNIDNPTTRDPLLIITKEDNSPIKESAEQVATYLEKAKAASDLKDTAQVNAWYGVILLKNNRCELGKQHFEEAIKIGDKYSVYSDAHKYYAICLYYLDSNDEALSEIETALKADPVDLDSWLYKAYICQSLENLDCVSSTFDKLITVDGNNQEYRSLYAEYLLSQGQYQEAISNLETLYSLKENSSEKNSLAIRISRLILEHMSSQPKNEYNWEEKAETYLGQVIDQTADYFDLKGLLAYLTGSLDTEDFTSAISKDPYHSWAYYHIALANKDQGNREEAIDYATKAIDYDFEGEVSIKATELLEELDALI